MLVNCGALALLLSQRNALAAQHRADVTLETQLREARSLLAEAEQSEVAAREDLAALRVRQATDDNSPASRLGACIQELKKLLDEVPNEKIPELILLTPQDWIEVAHALLQGTHGATGESPLFTRMRAYASGHDLHNPIYSALADLRAKARQKFAPSLQAALRRFLATAHGELPADFMQLAPFIEPPADPSMLARYEMKRTGKAGADDEKIMVEKTSANQPHDPLLSVSLESAYFDPAPSSELSKSFGALGDNLAETVETLKFDPIIERAFGDHETFKRTMERGVDLFTQAAGRLPADFFELSPFLYHFDAGKFVQELRPLLAALAYAAVHEGKFTSDAALLRPYMDESTGNETTLRAIKIGPDGRSMDIKAGKN